jgi:hypothetical protein
MRQLSRFVRPVALGVALATAPALVALPAGAATNDPGGFAAAADALIRMFTEPVLPARSPAVAPLPVRTTAPARPATVDARSGAGSRRPRTYALQPSHRSARPRFRVSAARPALKASAARPASRPVRVAVLGKGAVRTLPRRPARPQSELGIDSEGNPAVNPCDSGWVDSCGPGSSRR